MRAGPSKRSTRHIRHTRHILLLAGLTLALLASCSGSSSQERAYISLGDSLAVGVGSSDPGRLGYTPLYREALIRRSGEDVRMFSLGIAGETSESFMGDYPDGPSQLGDAVEAVRRNPGARVTLSLGANDLLRSGGTNRERAAALESYARNLDYVLSTLTKTSDPPPRITVLALYNPAPGSFTDEWTGRLNRQIRRVSEENGAAVAAGDRAFSGDKDGYVRYTRYPWDIHPTDAGYAALARAFEDAR